ncbi:MAG: glycosyltransferase [Bacteroidota bacterium]
MELFYTILNILQYVLLFYLGLASLYFFIYAFASRLGRKFPSPAGQQFNRFVVLIPGYKEDQVIVDVAREATKQDYPKDYYDVIVIADSFSPETLEKLNELPVIVNVVEFEKSSKSKALNKTMSQIPDDKYDAVMILDADNVMATNVLSLMNDAVNAGFTAIQGHRMAKNQNTYFALLDAISEEINNSIFRKGHRKLGVSSALIGSGMAFKYSLYKNYMATIDSYGEDKELEFKLLADNIKIEYRDDAWVYDEKVSEGKVFVKQRTRWLFNQFYYAFRYLGEGIKQLLVKGNFDYFDKLFQQFLPPRIMLIVMTTVLTIGSFFYNPSVLSWVWTILFGIMVAAFALAVPDRFYTFRTFKAVFYIPYGFFLMMLSLSRLQSAKKGFGATTHTVTKVDDKTNNS